MAQDALLLAFKALPQLQDPAGFAPWLYAITRNRARRVLGSREGKAESIEHSHIDQLLLTAVSGLSINPADEVMNRCDHDMVPIALSRLPAQVKIVMELRYYEEWPVGRISEFLSLPATTVKWRLHEGRRIMRRSLAVLNELDA